MPQNIFKIYNGRTHFWQWTTKQKLIILDDTVTQVHFSNKNMARAIVRQATMESHVVVAETVIVGQVPNTFLQTGGAYGAEKENR